MTQVCTFFVAPKEDSTEERLPNEENKQIIVSGQNKYFVSSSKNGGELELMHFLSDREYTFLLN